VGTNRWVTDHPLCALDGPSDVVDGMIEGLSWRICARFQRTETNKLR